MGGGVLRAAGFACRVITRSTGPSSADDTRAAAAALAGEGVDLILFAGGDGTARDVLDGLSTPTPALGIPAGVKMQSAVFALSPGAAAEIVAMLARGELVGLAEREVRDIDEQALREGRVASRYYGELLAPEAARYMQHLKMSGREDEALVQQEIADAVLESMEPDVLYIVGPGSTTRAITEALGLRGSLLGVDLLRDGQLLAADVDEAGILAQLQSHAGPARIVVSATGGQGSLLGRGNQQISPAVLRRVGPEHLLPVASKRKLRELEGRPLLVDTGDAELDRQLSRYHKVLTAYRDEVLYPVAAAYC